MEFQPVNTETQTRPKPAAPLVAAKPQTFFAKSTELSKSLLANSYAQSLQSINIGFSMASALAWNEVVKEYALKNVSVRKSQYYHVIYASAVTVFAAFVFMITKMFLDSNIKRSNITPVVGFR